MSLPEFQRALSEMVMSPGFRNRVAEDPGSALSTFDLSDRELRRLEALARDARLKTGTLLHRSTRLSMLSNTMPRTCRVLGSKGLKELTHAYWSEHPPYSAFFIQEGIRFGRFALERLAEGQDLARAVLETELAMLELTEAEGVWEEPRESAPPPPSGVWVPRLHPLGRAIRFHHPPLTVFAELDAGRVPRDLPEGERILLLLLTAPKQVSLRDLPADQGRVLLAVAGSSGRATVAELCRTRPAEVRAFEEALAAGYLIAEAAPA